MGAPDKLSGPERLVLAWLAVATAAGLCWAVARMAGEIAAWLALALVRAGGAS